MRVVIAGAGGRMGRTLIGAIAATKSLTLAAVAVEFARSSVRNALTNCAADYSSN